MRNSQELKIGTDDILMREISFESKILKIKIRKKKEKRKELIKKERKRKIDINRLW